MVSPNCAKGFQVCFQFSGIRRHIGGFFLFFSCFAGFCALISASETMAKCPGCLCALRRAYLGQGTISSNSLSWIGLAVDSLTSLLPFINWFEFLGVFTDFLSLAGVSLLRMCSDLSINFFLHNKKRLFVIAVSIDFCLFKI